MDIIITPTISGVEEGGTEGTRPSSVEWRGNKEVTTRGEMKEREKEREII